MRHDATGHWQLATGSGKQWLKPGQMRSKEGRTMMRTWMRARPPRKGVSLADLNFLNWNRKGQWVPVETIAKCTSDLGPWYATHIGKTGVIQGPTTEVLGLQSQCHVYVLTMGMY